MQRTILIKSCERFQTRRDAVEATWGRKLAHFAEVVYVVGGGQGPAKIDGPLIRTSTGDGYGSNSWKVRDAIRLLLEKSKFESLFVCDDDTFVHWWRWLNHLPREFEGLKTEAIPWIHGGAGWYMNRRACEAFVDGIKRRCSWDDRLATEILEPLGFEMTNRPDLYSQWEPTRVSGSNALITCHHVNEAEMRDLYESTYETSAVHNVLQ
jgi:hypothetical protein